MLQEQKRAPRSPLGRPSRADAFMRRTLALALLALALGACGNRSGEDLGTDSQRVETLTQAKIFGFESTSAWAPTQGTGAPSSVRTEGQSSLAFTVGGYTELRSVPLGSLGRAPEGFSFDLRLPRQQTNPWWLGAVQMFVSVPSRGINNHYLGQHELTGRPLEKFFTLSYAVPASLGAVLAGQYSDLQLKIVLNVPYGNGPYLLDNLRLDPSAGTPGDEPPPCHPYARVGSSGTVRYELATVTRRDAVELFVQKSGVETLLRTFSEPTEAGPNDTFVYRFDHSASNYQTGDEILVRFRSTEGGTTHFDPGPGNAWAVALRYDPATTCRVVADDDLDGVANPDDRCRHDRAKTDPGLCGCGNPETNSDLDRLPDCVDHCPLDPLRVEPGDCGCSGAFSAAGTLCRDGAAVGMQTCNGTGSCGDIAPGRPPWAQGPIEVVRHRDEIYVVVSDTGTFTEVVDGPPLGYRIVRIDSELENVLVTELVNRIGTTASVWIDASSTFIKWAPGHPGGGTGCVFLDASGLARQGSCSDSRSVVYERSNRTLTFTGDIERVTCADFPGLVCDPNEDPVEEPCVDQDAPLDEQARARLAACQACLETNCPTCAPGELGPCASECVGVAAPPPPGSTCVRTGPHCAVEAPLPEPTTCRTDEDCCGQDCDGSVVCGPFVPAECVRTPCDPADGSCEPEPCPAVLRCGTPVEGCEPDDPEPVCGETVLCPEDGAVGHPDPFGVGLAPLAENTPFVPAAVFGTPAPIVRSQFPSAADELANGTPPEPENHPYCRYAIDNPLAPKTVSDEKAGSAGQGRAVQLDIDPNITLDYSVEPLPAGQLDYHLTAEASLAASVNFDVAGMRGGFDILNAVLSARADRCGYSTADSKLELFGNDFLPDLLGDVLVDTQSDTCEASLAAHQEVADRAKKAMRDAQDLLRQYHAARAAGRCFDPSAFCTSLLADAPRDFPVIDCATAAVEDVINLFTFYYHRQIDAEVSWPDLPGLRMPPGAGARFADFRLPNPSVPTLLPTLPDLAPGSPIEFLGDLRKLGSLPDLKGSGRELVLKGVAAPRDGLFPRSTFGCQGPGTATHRNTLFKTTVMLGPIPVVLEVESVLKYGLGGELKYELKPERLADLASATGTTKPVSIASVTANAAPCVSAGMGLFVGAGFSIAGLRAAAGVEGIVNFGTLQMPAEATANIAVSAEDAPVAETKPREESCAPTDVDCVARQSVRELADDMKGIVDGELLRQRRFSVHLGYTYGVGLKADEILAGHLKAALKVRFLWFKRQWRRTIVDFGKGVSLGERMLIADEGSNAWGGSVPWGTLEMPNPFLKFRYLKRLSEKLAAAGLDDLLDAGLTIPALHLPDLGSVDIDLGDLTDVPVLRADLPDIGRRLGFKDLASTLAASGIDLDAMTFADFAAIDFELSDFDGVPLELGHLRALDLDVPELAELGVNVSTLAPELPGLLNLQGLSLARLSSLGFDIGDLDEVEIDWKHLPRLGWLLNRPDLGAQLIESGADWTSLRLRDFERLGFDVSDFGAWPLTDSDVAALNLDLQDLMDLGLDLSGLQLDLDDLVARGLDLSKLKVSDLGRLGFTLPELGAIAVPRVTLARLSAQLEFPDIQLELEAQGKDLDNLHLSDLTGVGATLLDFPDRLLGSADLRGLDLDQSDLLKLGFDLSSVDTSGLPDVTCDAHPSTSLVGKFFYDRQCTCRPEFDAEKPYAEGQQSCVSNADCCASAPYCSMDATAGHHVCSRCAPGDCGSDPSSYECSLDMETGVTDCTGFVQRTEYTPGTGEAPMALVRLDFADFDHFTLSAEICQQAGWVLNIGDSFSNNGGGGDNEDFSNDSELQIFDRELQVYGDDTPPRNTLLLARPDFLWMPADCGGATIAISRSAQAGLLSASANSVIQNFSSERLFRIGAPDTEGPSDTILWAGLNRAVGNTDRRGQGVRSARFRFTKNGT
jgi:hypothetical protein